MNREPEDRDPQIRPRGIVTDWQGPPHLGALLVSGPDAVGFLHTQLTSDVRALQPGDGQASAALLRSGAVQGLFHLFRLPDRGQPFPSFFLLADSSLVPGLQRHLEAFVVTAAVEIEDVGGEFGGILVQGPEQAVEDLRGGLPDLALVFEVSLTGDPGFLALYPSGADTVEIENLLTATDLVRLADDESGRRLWNELRLEAGWLLPGRDYEPGATILSATGMEHRAVSWTKGCYPGQEVVARIRTYGSVPRCMAGLIIHEPLGLAVGDLPATGLPVLASDGAKIGTWASGGYSAVWDRPVALAYLDRDHRAPGTRLQLAAGERELEAEVVTLPFYTGTSAEERALQAYRQAVHLFGSGQDDRAVALLQEAVTLDTGLTEAWEALGVVLGRMERYHEAIDIFRRLEELAPDEPMVNTNLSLFSMKLGDKEEAEKQKALATLKKFGSGLTAKEIAVRDETRRREKAADARRRKALFAEVLELDPVDGPALMGMGGALFDLGEAEEAEPYLAKACEVMGDSSPLFVSHGRVLEGLGRRGEAVDVYRRGIAVAARKGDLMPLRELEHRLFLLEESNG